MARTVYLGKRVKDTGKKGLDTLREVEDICRAIIYDYTKKRISYATAMRRLTFLRTTVIKRSSKMTGKKRKAYAIVERYKEKLKRMRTRTRRSRR